MQLVKRHGIAYHPNNRMSVHMRELRCKQYYSIFTRFKFEDFTFDEVKDVITRSDLMIHNHNAWFINHGSFNSTQNKQKQKPNRSIWKLNPMCKSIVEKTLGVELTQN